MLNELSELNNYFQFFMFFLNKLINISVTLLLNPMFYCIMKRKYICLFISEICLNQNHIGFMQM